MLIKEVHIKDFGNYEIELARAGWIRLIWVASPHGFSNFEIRQKDKTIYENTDLRFATKRFNELV